jgi:hypothetical protein
MKHILNNISRQEKNSILEQYSGGKRLQIENFSKLVNSKLGDVKTLITEDFSNQMSYGDLKFAGDQGENIRIYVKENPVSVVYAFIKKDGEDYYGKTGFGINFEGTNENYMVSDDYSGVYKTDGGWVKMKSYDDPDFYREFVERAFKLSDIKLQYLSKKL